MSALLAFVLAQNDFIDPGGGPEPSGEFRVSPTVFIFMFGAGFLLGIFGHLFKSRTMVAAGVLLIFLATVLVPVFLAATR